MAPKEQPLGMQLMVMGGGGGGEGGKLVVTAITPGTVRECGENCVCKRTYVYIYIHIYTCIHL